MPAYADARVPIINTEVKRYCCALVPILGEVLSDPPVPAPGDSGSGTCVIIGGRYFIATAGHVMKGYPKTRFFVSTPREDSDLVLDFIDGNAVDDEERGDVGWLELTAASAKIANREFLPLERIRTHCAGTEDELIVYGSPVSRYKCSTAEDGKEVHTKLAQWWGTRALMDDHDIREPSDPRRMYLKWPKWSLNHDGTRNEYPEPGGISGGAVWALNSKQPTWTGDHIQLVGIEYSQRRDGVPERYLRAYQMQVWLELLATDRAELRPIIEPHIAAGRFQPPRS